MFLKLICDLIGHDRVEIDKFLGLSECRRCGNKDLFHKSKHYEKLRYGAEHWNKWRLSEPNIEVDLFNESLSSICDNHTLENYNFSNTNLQNTKFYNVYNLKKIDFSNSNLRLIEFRSYGRIENVDFKESNLEYAKFTYVTISKCNMIKVNLNNTKFTNIKFIDVDLSNSFGTNIIFKNCLFNNCKLLNTVFTECEFIDTIFFKSSNKEDAEFNDCKILGKTKQDWNGIPNHNYDPRFDEDDHWDYTVPDNFE